jgi:CheY-like chemotaxis protein
VLRQDPGFAAVPIVALTAHALEDERAAAMLDGFDGVISKPCLPDELIERIQPYLTAIA